MGHDGIHSHFYGFSFTPHPAFPPPPLSTSSLPASFTSFLAYSSNSPHFSFHHFLTSLFRLHFSILISHVFLTVLIPPSFYDTPSTPIPLTWLTLSSFLTLPSVSHPSFNISFLTSFLTSFSFHVFAPLLLPLPLPLLLLLPHWR